MSSNDIKKSESILWTQYPVPGQWLTPAHMPPRSAPGTRTYARTSIYLTPFYVHSEAGFTSLSYFKTAATATSTAFAIYESRGDGSTLPGRLLRTLGDSSSGTQTSPTTLSWDWESDPWTVEGVFWVAAKPFGSADLLALPAGPPHPQIVPFGGEGVSINSGLAIQGMGTGDKDFPDFVDSWTWINGNALGVVLEACDWIDRDFNPIA